MRILKYLLLLILLLFIGLSVFVSTQKANFNITSSQVIKAPKAIVYNYIGDFRNWETFVSWTLEDEKAILNYPSRTSGNGSFYSWEGNQGNGKTTTLSQKINDSIYQKMITNGEESNVIWKFKDTLGGTKVTLISKGKLDFKSKIIAFFNGGIKATVEDSYAKSLNNLNKTLDYEINTFSIKENGVVSRFGSFYIKQSILCREKSVSKNIKILIPKLKLFFEKNNIVMNGKPFVMYNKYDKINDIVDLSVCISVKDSLQFSAKSEVQCAKLLPYTAVKTTLTGNYAHIQKAWKKGDDYIIKNKLQRNSALPIIEVYTKGIDEAKQPSKWITEIYIPVQPKAAPKPVYKKTIDSTAVVQPSIPDELSIK